MSRTKINLKTPISYYGGKQSMLKHIMPLIPTHNAYVEPFCGGCAVFWAKEPGRTEILNDTNGMVVNFYEQLKTNYDNLKRIIDATPYSRDVYRRAMVVYDYPYMFEPVVRAWAFWVCTVQGFSNKIGSWRSSSLGAKEPLLLLNKKSAFTKELSERLRLVQIENKDALHLIDALDSPDTFFYVDPPYVDSNQGHYGGYTQQHFDALLNTLAEIKGKFLLSSYPNQSLAKFSAKYNWICEGVDMHLSSANGANKRKTEMLTRNYSI